MTILKVVGIELAVIGRIEAAEPGDEAIVHEDAAGGRYRKLVITDGRIVGAILLGPGNDVAAVRTAITRGFDVTPELAAPAPGPPGRAGQAQRGHPLVPAVRRLSDGIPRRNAPRRLTGHAAETPPPADAAVGSPCSRAPAAANAAVTANRRQTRRTSPSPVTPRPTTSRSASTPPATSRTTANGAALADNRLRPGPAQSLQVRRHAHRDRQRRRRQRHDQPVGRRTSPAPGRSTASAGDDIIVGATAPTTIPAATATTASPASAATTNDQRRQRQRRDDLEQRRRHRHQQR